MQIDAPEITDWSQVRDVTVDGEGMGRGLVERDYEQNPQGSYSAVRPFSIDTIPMEQWPEWIKRKNEENSWLTDFRMKCGPNGGHIPALNQGSSPYCWAHSPVTGAMLARAAQGMDYVELSAFSVAVPIKNGRLQGGWSPEAFEFMGTRGVSSTDSWPRRSMTGSHADALQYRISEGFSDLNPPVYNRNLSMLQTGTSVLLNMPVNADYNHWRHSVCLIQLRDARPQRPATDPTRYDGLVLNSWGDNWGNLGLGWLVGMKWVPDGACAIGDIVIG